MNRELTYATVCSGIECMSVACRGLPMRPMFFSEIEPFPCAVLKAHYPDVPNLGDMSKITVKNQTEITNGRTTITIPRPLDIFAGGTPCQDVSVAGKRAGMSEGSGTRSSLAFDFVRLARELGPRYIIWENVAGSIDSKNAPDFARFLDALRQCGYTLAYRILDAQYVRVDGVGRAVPQRRRRVWVVGCSGADESRAAQILLEPDCVAGHTPPRRRTGHGFDYSLGGRDKVDAGLVGGAPGTCGEGQGGGECLNPLDPQMKRLFTPDGAFHSLCANNGAGQATDGVCIALDGDKLKPRTDQRKGGNGFGINEDGAGYTVTATDRHGVAYKPEGKGKWWDGKDVAQTITTTGHNQLMPDKDRFDAVVQCYENHATDARCRKVEAAPVMGATRNGNASNNNPRVVHRQTPRAVGLDGYNQQTTGGVISTNSNGEDVAPTLTSTDLVKQMTGEADRGGGYVVTRALGIGRDVIECGKAAKFSPDIREGVAPTLDHNICQDSHFLDETYYEVVLTKREAIRAFAK